MGLLEGAVLPKASIILVTGANGLIGSHVVDQFLRHGYKVRGTVRDAQKSGWLAKHFNEQYGEGQFELVEIKDLTDVDALKKALQGCAGFAATASDVSFGFDPNDVVTAAVNLVKAALEAAAASPSVKRFVLTSSSTAAASRGAGPDGSRAGQKFDLGVDAYNTDAIDEAWAPPPYDSSRSFAVYRASKTQQEQEAWKFVSERKPGFVLNSVLPDFVVGKILSPEKQGTPSSIGFLKAAWDGNVALATMLPPQYEIDVEDTAMLHVAAMLHPDVQGERVFGYAFKKNLTNTLQLLRELYPQRKLMDPPENEGEFEANILGRPRAEEVLQWVKGSGWASYKESLKKACDTWV
ncbi:unnamed protein product [Discula destructiva]